jgi:hypothetical protein
LDRLGNMLITLMCPHPSRNMNKLEYQPDEKNHSTTGINAYKEHCKITAQ